MNPTASGMGAMGAPTPGSAQRRMEAAACLAGMMARSAPPKLTLYRDPATAVGGLGAPATMQQQQWVVQTMPPVAGPPLTPVVMAATGPTAGVAWVHTTAAAAAPAMHGTLASIQAAAVGAAGQPAELSRSRPSAKGKGKGKDVPATVHACDKCEFKSTRRDIMTRHRKSCGKTHDEKRNKPRSFACTECGYRTAHKGHLGQHMRTHTGEKPFACEFEGCTYRAGKRWDVTVHMRSHTGIKPYACPHCPYRAGYKSDLTAHIRIHTGEKPYACELCNYKAKQRAHLQRHMMVHTGEKPYSCPTCSYSTANKADLAKHTRTHDKPGAGVDNGAAALGDAAAAAAAQPAGKAAAAGKKQPTTKSMKVVDLDAAMKGGAPKADKGAAVTQWYF